MTIHVDPWFVYAFALVSLIPWALRARLWWMRRKLAQRVKDTGVLQAQGEVLDRIGAALFDTPRIVESDVAYRARLKDKLDQVTR